MDPRRSEQRLAQIHPLRGEAPGERLSEFVSETCFVKGHGSSRAEEAEKWLNPKIQFALVRRG
jgi:hypothetical protein